MKVRRRFNQTTPAHKHLDFITPNERLFTVYHLGIPQTDASTWTVTIDGLVEKPCVLSLDDLKTLPEVEVCAFHECAGSPMRPTVPVRRVSNALWRGVRLKDVLARVGVDPAARYLWLHGADSGVYPPTGHDNDCYLKDVPLHSALNHEALLATAINGRPLLEEHGGPLRLFIPGYYGTNSVKWLTHITLAAERCDGYFSAVLYNDRRIRDGVETLEPVWKVAPNSIIVSPGSDPLRLRDPIRVWGWAWGSQEISAVQVSTDGGREWTPAALDARSTPSWQRFWLDWTPDRLGACELVSRAVDATGESQPMTDARNEVFRRPVTIVPAGTLLESNHGVV